VTWEQLAVYLAPVVISLLIYIKSRFDARAANAKQAHDLELREKDLELQRKSLELKMQQEQAENAKAVRDTMTYSIKHAGQLEEQIEKQDKQIDALREQLEARDNASRERDKEIETLKRQVNEQGTRITTLLKTIEEKDAIILSRDTELREVRGELKEVRDRLTALERAPKPATGELSKSVNADVDPAAA